VTESPGAAWLRPALGGVVVVVCLLMLGTALFPAPHNGGDNAGYLTLAHSLTSQGAYLDLWQAGRPAHTKYPPLYPLALALMSLVGVSSWTAFKTFSLLCVAGTAAVTYAWVSERRSPWGAAVLALVVVLGPAFLWASNWILSDPLFVLLTVTAVWAFERGGVGGPRGGTRMGDAGPSAGIGWLVVGCSAAILATFARTAGLPLVLAVAATLLLARRMRALTVFGAAFALPQLLWWLRSRATGNAAYVSEFWMVDPYDPAQGTAGLGDLVARMLENASGYALQHIPAGLAPYGAPGVGILGLTLLVLAVAGWIAAVRRRVGLAELFGPLYAGLILLWPAVWSGDRFALPLYPVVLYFAWGGLEVLLERFHSRAPAIAAGVLAAILLAPSLGGWRDATERASACRSVVRSSGPFACYGGGFQEFVLASRWLGEHAVDGARAFTRKPRIFYTLSGLSGKTYPFTTDPDAFFAEADSLGVRYVILDRIDRLGYGYVAEVVRARPERFCSLAGIGSQAPRTEILGLLPATAAAGEEGIGACPDTMVREVPRELPPYESQSVPLLSFATP